MTDMAPHNTKRLSGFCKPVSCLVALQLAFLTASLFAAPMVAMESITDGFNHITRLEWPRHAARIVAAAPAQERENLAVALVEIIHGKIAAPALTVSVVSEIALATPEVAPAIAAKAVQLLPQFSAAITSAATNAAPGSTQSIMAAIKETGIQTAPKPDLASTKTPRSRKLDPRTLIDHSTNQPSLLLKPRH